MPTGIAILVLLSVNAAGAFWMVHIRSTQTENARTDELPISTIVLSGLVIVGAHLICLGFVWNSLDTTNGSMGAQVVMIGCTIFPAAPSGLLLAKSFIETSSTGATDRLVGLTTASAPEPDYSKAKAMQMRGDIDDALAEYRRAYRESPSTAKPLFEAHRMLCKANRHDEGADLLREALRSFADDDRTWARAAVELANYFQNDAGNDDAARKLLHQVVKRVPSSEYGRMAHGRLTNAWGPDNRE